MKQFVTYLSVFCLLLGTCLFTACAAKDSENDVPYYNNLQRLIIRGQITNSDSQPVAGIRVDLEGVGNEEETNAANYNYAITDGAGQYIICRYLGREIPQQVTVIASDPQQFYQSQTQTIQTDPYIATNPNRTVFEIKVDFILTQK